MFPDTVALAPLVTVMPFWAITSVLPLPTIVLPVIVLTDPTPFTEIPVFWKSLIRFEVAVTLPESVPIATPF